MCLCMCKGECLGVGVGVVSRCLLFLCIFGTCAKRTVTVNAIHFIAYDIHTYISVQCMYFSLQTKSLKQKTKKVKQRKKEN